MATPASVSLDANGYVYVCQSYVDRVLKFSPSGTLLAQWASYGVQVAAGPNGNLYTPDGRYDRMTMISADDGALLLSWGSRGTGDGQFMDADGVAVDAQGNVYVADRGNSRIQKFTSGGTFITKWGLPGRGDGQFDWPVRIAIGSGGTVYVVDYHNARVQVFTSDGDYVGQWGGLGSGPGQFYNPIGIAMDAGGKIYVADAYNGRIQVFGFSPTAALLTSWGALKARYR